MMNSKWVTEIQLVNEVFQGYWQRRGWKNAAEYQTSSSTVLPGSSLIDSRFEIPGSGEVPPGAVATAGIAFAGDRGIEKVEVSTDGGQTWTPASLKEPLSNYTWVLWSSRWNPPASGDYKITVRATDKRGNVQTAVVTDPFPNGATGYHIVDIKVKSGS
jgi:DMSO/TMAO reductase YedYZ molybdopterin-dependent catalytic subunit